MHYKSQRTDFWCWAASIEMIMDFHVPSDSTLLDQCRLAKDIYLFNEGFLPEYHNDIEDSPCCCKCSGDGWPAAYPGCSNNSFSKDISKKTAQYTAEVPGNPSKAYPDNYDLLFSKYGFTSIQQINRFTEPMKWSEIKRELGEFCRPFILNISDGPVSEASSNHAIVAMGFYEDTVGQDIQLLVANDPWRPCNSKNEIAFYYDNFITSTISGYNINGGSFVSSVYSAVHSIQPGTVFENADPTQCLSCMKLDTTYGGKSYIRVVNDGQPQELPAFRSPSTDVSAALPLTTGKNPDTDEKDFPNEPQPSLLLDILEKHGEQVIGFKQKEFKEDSLQTKLDSTTEYFYAPVHYVSSRLLNNQGFLGCLFRSNKLENVIVPEAQVIEVLNNNIERTVASTFQKVPEGNWMFRKMTTYSYLENELSIVMPDQTDSLFLDNRTSVNSDNKVPFQLIKYYPFQYEFFSFIYDNEVYLAPAANFPELEGYNKHQAYPAKELVRVLRKKTSGYEKFVQSLFPKNSLYKDYLKGLKDFLPVGMPIYQGINLVNYKQ
jgi:hypothetical protein